MKMKGRGFEVGLKSLILCCVLIVMSLVIAVVSLVRSEIALREMQIAPMRTDTVATTTGENVLNRTEETIEQVNKINKKLNEFYPYTLPRADGLLGLALNDSYFKYAVQESKNGKAYSFGWFDLFDLALPKSLVDRYDYKDIDLVPADGDRFHLRLMNPKSNKDYLTTIEVSQLDYVFDGSVGKGAFTLEQCASSGTDFKSVSSSMPCIKQEYDTPSLSDGTRSLYPKTAIYHDGKGLSYQEYEMDGKPYYTKGFLVEMYGALLRVDITFALEYGDYPGQTLSGPTLVELRSAIQRDVEDIQNILVSETFPACIYGLQNACRLSDDEDGE